jgi:DNA repair protein RecN (Recombination protein N)
MLTKLFVQNYALIRELDVEFEGGLTIITGETGAGKSILLGALSLILGNRADTGVLLNKEEKCIVEGTFRIEDPDMKEYFNLNELDWSPSSTLRREISPAGKSRAFINDTPVTVNILKELGDRLIDIHSQHQTLMLSDNSFQMNIIDSFAGTVKLKNDYKQIYTDFLELKQEYAGLKVKADRNRSDLEYFEFQFRQLTEAGLRKGEQEELEAEQELLTHAEDIKTALVTSSLLLERNESSVLSMLQEIKNNLLKVREYLPNGQEMVSRLEASFIELDDLAHDIGKLEDTIEADPGRLAGVNERLDLLYSLIRKHRVEDLAGLIDKKDEIGRLVRTLEGSDARLTELEVIMVKETKRLSDLAGKMSDMRKAVLANVESKVTDTLKQLGMPNARFRILLNTVRDFALNGVDQADFLFSANKQIQPENLAKIASGGELSRVMLSLKSLLSRNNNLPTIIFDEIDSGVSGEVADKVGQILSGMGEYMQVINITHLPQVASRGKMHYHIYKDDTDDATFTRVKLLSKDERILEVARLLSGSEITEAAIKNAKELLSDVIN